MYERYNVDKLVQPLLLAETKKKTCAQIDRATNKPVEQVQPILLYEYIYLIQQLE